jgi:hypothetical protein
MTGTANRTEETAEAETEQTAETGEITETGTATGAETKTTETETQTEIGTDNSTGVGTGRIPGTKTETGHSRETGIQEIEMVTQETEDAVENGDKREQPGQTMRVQTDQEQIADKENSEIGVTVET